MWIITGEIDEIGGRGGLEVGAELYLALNLTGVGSDRLDHDRFAKVGYLVEVDQALGPVGWIQNNSVFILKTV
jgi:hypothetical protein